MDKVTFAATQQFNMVLQLESRLRRAQESLRQQVRSLSQEQRAEYARKTEQIQEEYDEGNR